MSRFPTSTRNSDWKCVPSFSACICRPGSTFVYVTHDQMEAMTLATRICLMENGVLQQYDEPLTVYGKPSNLFVADFVGNPAINFIEARALQKQDGAVELTMLAA